jgi:acetyl esterase/lipase
MIAESKLNEMEKGYRKYFNQIACNQYDETPFCNLDDVVNNPMIFSNEMGLELASQVPPTIIYTTEFDFFRKMGEEACSLYEEAGTLLDCGIWKGVPHMTFTAWGNPAS